MDRLDLSLAAFAGVPLVVRVLAVTVIVLAAAGHPHPLGRAHHAARTASLLGLHRARIRGPRGREPRRGPGPLGHLRRLPAEAGVAALAGVVLIGSGLALRLSISMPGRALGVVFEALMCIAALALVTWGALLMTTAIPSTPRRHCCCRSPTRWRCGSRCVWFDSHTASATATRTSPARSGVCSWSMRRSRSGASARSRSRSGSSRLCDSPVCASGPPLPSCRRCDCGRTTRCARSPQLGPGRLAANLGVDVARAGALRGQRGGRLAAAPDGSLRIEHLPFLVAVYLVRQVQEGARAEYQAQHDPLTGLPHRVLFLDRLEVAARGGPADRQGGRGLLPRPRPVQGNQRQLGARGRE